MANKDISIDDALKELKDINRCSHKYLDYTTSLSLTNKTIKIKKRDENKNQ